MIVLDASAAVDLLLGTERGAGVAQVLGTVALGTVVSGTVVSGTVVSGTVVSGTVVSGTVSEVHAPELLDPEVMAVIRRWTSRGWLTVEMGGRAVDELGELAVVRHRHRVLRRRVWELRDRCSAYDGCYVALAESLGASLLTTDARLGRAAQGLVDVVSP